MLYTIVLVSAIHQHESAIGIHMSLPSWTFLHFPPHPPPLGIANSHWLPTLHVVMCMLGFPGGSDGKESACNAEDVGLIPWLGRSPGEGNGYPLYYCCLENSMGRKSLVGYSHQGYSPGLTKIQTWLTSTFTSQCIYFNPLSLLILPSPSPSISTSPFSMSVPALLPCK